MRNISGETRGEGSIANSAGHCSHRCRQNPFLSARKMHLANDEAEQSQEKQRGSGGGIITLVAEME